jgi:hypothetical protein
MDEIRQKILMSSENNKCGTFKRETTSFTKILNSSGPRTDPRGTPDKALQDSDFDPFM